MSHHPRLKSSLVLAVGLAASVTLAACSSGSGHGSMHSDSMMGGSSGMKNQPVANGARKIRVEAESFRFTPKKIELTAGEKAAIVLTSTDVEHDFTVEGGDHIVHVKGDETATGGLTIDRPGTYTFYCSVSGHRQAGMTGTLVVR